MTVDEKFKSEMAKKYATFGSEVSTERVTEIMTESAIPGNKVAVTKEEASACGVESMSAAEVRAVFGDDLSALSDEDAWAGVQTEEFKTYVKK
jgi:hypothetical protein